jgi:hypothetical protein
MKKRLVAAYLLFIGFISVVAARNLGENTSFILIVLGFLSLMVYIKLDALGEMLVLQSERKILVTLNFHAIEDDLEYRHLQKEISFASIPRAGDVLNTYGYQFKVEWLRLDDEGGVIAVCDLRVKLDNLEEHCEDLRGLGWQQAHNIYYDPPR